MKYSIIICSLIIITIPTFMLSQTLKGEYRLQGIQDAASAFNFTQDGRYEFFFIYGAVDRNSTGTYTINGNILTLKSDKIPGKDFPVTMQENQGKGYTVMVRHDNPYLVQNVACIYTIDGKENVVFSDSHGGIHIEEKHVDKLSLLHELFPDVPSVIKDETNNNTYFEVGLSPSLAEVSFSGITFTIDGKSISCEPNQVLPFKHVVFIKQ